jgi:hypothetical protein
VRRRRRYPGRVELHEPRKLAAELAPLPAQRGCAGTKAPRGAALPDDEWSI